MLPNFLIIGAEKAGTTWLYEQLGRHPEIHMPLTKEIHYFNSRDSNLRYRNNFERHGIDWYEHFFRGHAGEAAIGEVTPMYLCDRDAPKRIRETLPDVRLIACLRHPVDRAHSHYWMARGKGHTDLSFEEVARRREPRFIGRGHYGEQLARYYNCFDSRQILVLIHEEMFKAPSRSLNRVCAFLEVDNTFFQGQEWLFTKKNKSAALRSRTAGRLIGKAANWMRRHRISGNVLDIIKRTGFTDWLKERNRQYRRYPPIDPGVRRELNAYYKPQVRQAEQLIGRQIDVWRDRPEEL